MRASRRKTAPEREEAPEELPEGSRVWYRVETTGARRLGTLERYGSLASGERLAWILPDGERRLALVELHQILDVDA